MCNKQDPEIYHSFSPDRFLSNDLSCNIPTVVITANHRCVRRWDTPITWNVLFPNILQPTSECPLSTICRKTGEPNIPKWPIWLTTTACNISLSLLSTFLSTVDNWSQHEDEQTPQFIYCHRTPIYSRARLQLFKHPAVPFHTEMRDLSQSLTP